MKILGLVASPRRSGNSELLVKEMLASAPAGTEKEMIRLPDLAIKTCKACYACLPVGKKCVINDDLDFLLERIRNADALIIASPCYFLGSHTSIKTISDRLISVMDDEGGFRGKRCVTVVNYGISEWEGYAREAVNNFARFLHLDVVGDLLVNAAIPGESLEEKTIQVAHDLMKRLSNPVSAAAEYSSATGLLCSECQSSLLQISATGRIRCVMCGQSGQLQATAGRWSVEFQAQEPARFSREGMNEHRQKLELLKTRYLEKRKELARRCAPYADYDWWVQPKG